MADALYKHPIKVNMSQQYSIFNIKKCKLNDDINNENTIQKKTINKRGLISNKHVQ